MNAVFIHGILQRSGTNFLNQLLLLHPKLEQPNLKVRENWFLHFSDDIKAYIDQLEGLWSTPSWGGVSYNINALYNKIGEAELEFLKEGIPADKTLLTKTPSFKNIQYFNYFFPNAKQILLVRNPFDIAASANKSWNRPIDKSLEAWQINCLEAFKLESRTSSVKIIRYEDLLLDTRSVIQDCLNYLEFNSSDFPWEETEKLPLFGSSESGSKWAVSQKKSNFKPYNRWKSLSEEKIISLHKYNDEIFNSYFGYEGILNSEPLAPLPSFEERLRIGEKIKSQFSDLKLKKENNRVQNLKKGLKLIYKSVKPIK